jgi:c-di-GMP-binding flagellar brake protein YcgR
VINKRQHKRIPLASFATVRRAGETEPDRLIQTFTADISMSGIGLYSDTPLDLDTDLAIAIHFMGQGGLITEQIEGRIVYVNEIGKFYFVGIQFREEISPVNQPLLHERLQRILDFY